MVARTESTRYTEEILERILDRGIVLDGLSHLAAPASNPGINAAALPDDSLKRATPMSLLCPPRERDRS